MELSDSFPKDQPVLCLLSVYHTLQGRPCQWLLKDYPYSPRWEVDEKVERLRFVFVFVCMHKNNHSLTRAYLLTVVSKFKDYSSDKGEFL